MVPRRRQTRRHGGAASVVTNGVGSLTRKAEAANPVGLLAAPPSVSAQSIEQALRAAGSPLADTGPRRAGQTYAEYLWDRGAALGIDPGVAMALFWYESHYGTLGIAVQTHNLANMRALDGRPSLCTDDGCYDAEPDWFAGIDSMYDLLRQYDRSGLHTVDQLIPVWAPPSDGNDVYAYITGVHERLNMLHTAP